MVEFAFPFSTQDAFEASRNKGFKKRPNMPKNPIKQFVVDGSSLNSFEAFHNTNDREWRTSNQRKVHTKLEKDLEEIKNHKTKPFTNPIPFNCFAPGVVKALNSRKIEKSKLEEIILKRIEHKLKQNEIDNSHIRLFDTISDCNSHLYEKYFNLTTKDDVKALLQKRMAKTEEIQPPTNQQDYKQQDYKQKFRKQNSSTQLTDEIPDQPSKHTYPSSNTHKPILQKDLSSLIDESSLPFQPKSKNSTSQTFPHSQSYKKQHYKTPDQVLAVLSQTKHLVEKKSASSFFGKVPYHLFS